MQATGRHHKVFGDDDVDAIRINLHRGRRFHHFLNRLHARPQARETAHGKGVQAHVQNVLHIAGEEHRRAAGLEDVIALVRRGGGFADVVIARNRNHAAMLRGARHVRVLEHVRAAIHTRPLAVPDAKNAVELLALGIQIQLLRAPDGRGTQLLIHAGLKDDVVRLHVLLGRPQRLVIRAQRRTTVAADKTSRVQPLLRITQTLQHGQANQRLHTAHERAAAIK